MNHLILLAGALIAAPLLGETPALDPAVREGGFHWFALTETREAVAKTCGSPVLVAPFGEDFIAWQYRTGETDHDSFSHYLIFRRSTGTLVAVTRNFEEETAVDDLFPPDESQTVVQRTPSGDFPARVRRFRDGRLLIALGAAGPGRKTSQLLLTRREELRYLQGWLYERLQADAR